MGPALTNTGLVSEEFAAKREAALAQHREGALDVADVASRRIHVPHIVPLTIMDFAASTLFCNVSVANSPRCVTKTWVLE